MILIWTALITIILLKALKVTSKFNWYLSNLIVFIRLNLFVKIDLNEWPDKPYSDNDRSPPKNESQGFFSKNGIFSTVIN